MFKVLSIGLLSSVDSTLSLHLTGFDALPMIKEGIFYYGMLHVDFILFAKCSLILLSENTIGRG